MLPVEKSCYWLATRSNYVPGPPLTGAQEADFAVIGAGFTGLWTAFFLRELAPSAKIVVVERSVAGYGASGRNAGIVSPSIDHSHNLAITHFGQAEAA
ncbi:MAG TPA: FAD-dependent oxidoreductase, partial [Chroococcales cyanobacterium]